MTTWRDVPWAYDGGHVFANIDDGVVVHICKVAIDDNTDSIGRAIAHAWNMDLAATQWARELFAVDDDSIGKVQDSVPPPHRY